MPTTRRATRYLVGTLLVYAVLVATHLGEFWPFTIYPMFSQGGQPWSRAIVRDVSRETGELAWAAVPLEELPGDGFATLEHGIDPIDLANFVSKTQRWDADRRAGLHRMFFAGRIEAERLLVMRANGRLVDGDSVVVEFVPYVLLEPDTTFLNPDLPR